MDRTFSRRSQRPFQVYVRDRTRVQCRFHVRVQFLGSGSHQAVQWQDPQERSQSENATDAALA